MSALPSDVERLEELRQEGDALCKQKKFHKAIDKYKKAAKLAPNNVSPLDDISAAYYEVGNYTQCISSANAALELLETGVAVGNEFQLKKFKHRIKKASAHMLKVSVQEKNDRRLKILKNLPKYHPSMVATPEYFYIGHDRASSLFDNTMLNNPNGSKTVSFFFGGIGDARHLFRTLIDIASYEKSLEDSSNKYHFTINDACQYPLARDLILFMLIDELSCIDSDTDRVRDILNALYFIYNSVVMPGCAFDILQQTITKLLDLLKMGEQPLAWLHMYEQDMPLYIKYLEQWAGEALELYTNSEFMAVAIKQLNKCCSRPKENEYEKQLYFKTLFLYPSDYILSKYESTLEELLEKAGKEPLAHAANIYNHVCKDWKINTTLIDVDTHKQAAHKKRLYIAHDPFDASESITWKMQTIPSKPKILYWVLGSFFMEVADAIQVLQGRMRVEAIYGDYTDFAEKIRFKAFRNSRNQNDVEYRPKGFPNLYDNIHLSNIPDYAGGHLTTFVFAAPLLKPNQTSILQSCCLRNCLIFPDLENFLTEYLLITDFEMLQKLLQVEVTSAKGFDKSSWGQYSQYRLAGPSLTRKFPDLLPRKQFNKWFYALFFRIALPSPINLSDFPKIIYSPLNISVIFHLLIHLNTLGYPAHWLSFLLSKILQNQAVSTTRPPRHSPTSVAVAKTPHLAMHLSTAPFIPELAMLTQIFAPLLPFALSPSISRILPPLQNIHKYTLHFPAFSTDPHPTTAKNLCLIFWDSSLFASAVQSGEQDIPYSPIALFRGNARAFLDPEGEAGLVGAGREFEGFRERGLTVWMGCEWDGVEKKVSAWLPEDVVERVGNGKGEGGWLVDVLDLDLWVGRGLGEWNRGAEVEDGEDRVEIERVVIEKLEGWVGC